MFQIGEKVVYPMYGAGVVENIEQDFRGTKLEKYYIIQIPKNNLKIRLVANKSEQLGVRAVAKREEVEKTLVCVGAKKIVMPENWSLRYKDNLEKLKTGKLDMVIEVVKNLNERERRKKLSSIEKKLLNTAKQIVLSEIICSYEIDTEKAEELLAKLVLNC